MILVTAATGRLGHHVVDALTGQGHHVHAASRLSVQPASERHVTWNQGDIRNPESLRSALKHVDALFLFPVFGGCDGFIRLAHDAGVKRIVLLSSAAVTDSQPNPIGRAHRQIEEVIEASGLEWNFVRPTVFMANDLAWEPASGGAGRVVLVNYFVAEEKVLVFIGRADFEEPRVYEVGVSRDALQVWVDEVFAKVKPCNYEHLWDLEAWQGEIGRLVEPVEECSDEGDVVWVVPHRELHHLPLHALKLRGRYLADRNLVFYTPSASVFRYSRDKNRGRVPETALVLGNSLSRTRPLDFAEGEAVAVATLFGTDAYLRDRASKDVLYEELRRTDGEVDVLHFACHGGFDAESPLESRIELAPGDGEGAEQPDFTVENVLGLELKATLVSLSACESGLSKIYPGEELVGLTRSFLYAGTPSLLVSLWSVHDRSTGLLMERFYGALLDASLESDAGTRTSKAEALRVAQSSVRSNDQFDHPFHWSSFVLVGDWK